MAVIKDKSGGTKKVPLAPIPTHHRKVRVSGTKRSKDIEKERRRILLEAQKKKADKLMSAGRIPAGGKCCGR